MGRKINAGERFEFIEGMRGIAAIMVLLGHYCSAFLPAFARVAKTPPHFSWETWITGTPVFSLINGTVAVYMFFTMSGFVLAGSFTKSNFGIPSQIAKRFLRLYPPIVCSVIFATLLLWSMPSVHADAARVSMSSWLAGLSLDPFTPHSFFGEALLSSMLTGYGGASIFDHTPYLKDVFPLTPFSIAANIPLWSLHAEFWGSMLVIALSAIYRRLPRPAFWLVFVVLLFVTGTSKYSLFLAGFAAYMGRHRLLCRNSAQWSTVGYALLGLGVTLSFTRYYQQFQLVLDVLAKVNLTKSVDGAQFQFSVAALATLLGLCITPSCRSFLCSRVPMWFGKISFSLYLTHFPILFTVASAVVTIAARHLGYGGSIALSCAIAWPLTFFVASVYERFIDQPSIAFSKLAAERRSTRSAPAS
ncbi:MAG TPA: acyltransferase [Trinickia sp.]|uniref:acyltransferase family protein n=1 Tax=Trinickia sp. TaxID=2571163 RepID=UPI002F42B065